MHRQLSSVMCVASTANASVLIVCCRRHCEPVAEYMHTLNCDVGAGVQGKNYVHNSDISQITLLLQV